MPDLVTRYGLMSVPDAEDDLIGRFLASYGEWAWLETKFVAPLLPDAARVLDIGAFLGTFGVGLSLLRKLDFVCFVEPNEFVIPHLTKNVRHLRKARSSIVEALATGIEKKARSGHSKPGNIGAASFAGDFPTESDYLPVATPTRRMTLPDLFEAHGDFDLIKIDAEGMESEILSGMGSEIEPAPLIWAECNEHPRSLELGQLLLSHGRPLYYFAFPSYNPGNFSVNRSPIYAFAYESGLLAGPGGEPDMPAELRACGCILRRISDLSDLKRALWETPRWGMSEWHGSSTETIVALAGHQLLGQEIDSFLTADEAVDRTSRPQSAIEVLRLRTRALQEALQQRARASQEELQQLQKKLCRAEEAAADADAVQKQLQAQMERNRQLSNANALLADKSRRLAAIEQSTTWRLMQHVLVRLASRPAVYRSLRYLVRRLLNRRRQLLAAPPTAVPVDTVLRQRLDAARPVSLQAQDWLGVDQGRHRLPQAELAAALRESLRRSPDLLVSVSHDDYLVNVGGVQNAINDEQKVFYASGCGYLHLSPEQPLPLLAPPAPDGGFLFSVRLDAQHRGVADCRTVVAALRDAMADGARLTLVVHHLMGHAPEALAGIADLCEPDRRFVWVHDFFSACPNYLLLRNDVAFCGAPPVGSPACSICIHGDDRIRHLDRVTRFFDETRPRIAAPSDSAAELWGRAVDLPFSELIVMPHCRIVFDADAPPPDPAQALRIAFAGAPVFHKGWSVFLELVSRQRDASRYAFFHFGISDGHGTPNVTHVDVRVTEDNRNAMIDALRRERIDVVILWSLCAETFSFIAHEALAAGAFVITSRQSGNVGRVIAANNPDQGLMLDNQSTLFEQFASGGICNTVRSSRRRTGRLEFARSFPHFVLGNKPAPVCEVA